MPKTLLAVDDSATMRKVLEITFGGEDFRVVTADGASAAISRLGEEPVAAVIDTVSPSQPSPLVIQITCTGRASERTGRGPDIASPRTISARWRSAMSVGRSSA